MLRQMGFDGDNSNKGKGWIGPGQRAPMSQQRVKACFAAHHFPEVPKGKLVPGSPRSGRFSYKPRTLVYNQNH